MEYLLIPVLYLTGCTKYVISYYLYTGDRIRLLRLLPGLIAAFIMLFFSNMVSSFSLAMITTGILVVSIFFLISREPYQRITIALILYFSLSSLTIFSSVLFFGLRPGFLTNAQRLACDLASIGALLIYAAVNRFLKGTPQLIKYLKRLLPPLLIFSAVILLVALEGIIHFAPDSRVPSHLYFAEVMTLLGLVAVMVTIWTAVHLFHLNREISKNAEIEKNYAKIRQQYLQALLDCEEETRRQRHDMEHNLICLKSLAMHHDLEGITAYIDNLKKDYCNLGKHVFHTGNEVFDCLTSYYSARLSEQVHLRVRGAVSDTGRISKNELCIIYANLLSNAIEELNRFENEEKNLLIHFIQNSNHFKIRIQNTCASDLGVVESTCTTRKKDRKNHGLGIQNVKRCVERNHGIISFQKVCRDFIVDVSLPTGISYNDAESIRII